MFLKVIWTFAFHFEVLKIHLIHFSSWYHGFFHILLLSSLTWVSYFSSHSFSLSSILIFILILLNIMLSSTICGFLSLWCWIFYLASSKYCLVIILFMIVLMYLLVSLLADLYSSFFSCSLTWPFHNQVFYSSFVLIFLLLQLWLSLTLSIHYKALFVIFSSRSFKSSSSSLSSTSTCSISLIFISSLCGSWFFFISF